MVQTTIKSGYTGGIPHFLGAEHDAAIRFLRRIKEKKLIFFKFKLKFGVI